MNQFITIPAAFVAMSVLCAVGAPRLWLCGIAALIMPPVAAFAVSVFSALAGNYALFIACRTRTAQRVVDWLSSGRLSAVGRLPRLRTGISGVVLLRQAPGPGAFITVFLSRTDVSARDFLIGSFIGFLPTTLVTVLLAGTAAHFLPANAMIWTTAAVAVAAGVVWYLKYCHWQTDNPDCDSEAEG